MRIRNRGNPACFLAIHEIEWGGGYLQSALRPKESGFSCTGKAERCQIFSMRISTGWLARFRQFDGLAHVAFCLLQRGDGLGATDFGRQHDER